MRVIYVPLEPYEERYTYQLKEWTERVFKDLKIDYNIIEGFSLATLSDIVIGFVLDVHQRTYWATSQIQELIRMAWKKEFKPGDFILFEDMYHPGIDALAYAFDLQYGIGNRTRPYIGMRCLAQSIDPDDFVHYTGMARWMRHYEAMVNSFVDCLFVASEEMVPFMTAAGWDVPVFITGLPFGKDEVLERLGEPVKPFKERKDRIVFASRIAPEKQPEFLVEVARRVKKHWPGYEFAILSGGLIKNSAIEFAVIDGVINVYPNLKKQEYYRMLNDSKVLFNCSLQDWVSNTLNEADALGCNCVFPAYRSFPEAFDNDYDRLYIPWSVESAVERICVAMTAPNNNIGVISDKQDQSIAKTIHKIKKMVNGNLSDSHVIYPSNTSYRKRITTRACEE